MESSLTAFAIKQINEYITNALRQLTDEAKLEVLTHMRSSHLLERIQIRRSMIKGIIKKPFIVDYDADDDTCLMISAISSDDEVQVYEGCEEDFSPDQDQSTPEAKLLSELTGASSLALPELIELLFGLCGDLVQAFGRERLPLSINP